VIFYVVNVEIGLLVGAILLGKIVHAILQPQQALLGVVLGVVYRCQLQNGLHLARVAL
jgi:hypothetical protein